MRLHTLILGLPLAWPAPSLAQEEAGLAAGARVRVYWMETSIRPRRAHGKLLELRTDSLFLAERAGPRSFAVARLHRIDVHVPRSRARGAVRGAGLGAVLGLGVGLVAGGVGAARCRNSEWCGIELIAGPVLGVTIGVPTGAVVGATHPGRRWRRVR